MKEDYIELFKQRKWKEALDSVPIGRPRIIPVETARDLQTLRVRASEFNRDSEKTASVSVDYEWDKKKEHVIVTVTKKNQ